MKYIVITCTKARKDGNQPSVIRHPFIFSDHLVHAHVAKVMELLLSLMHPTYDAKATSAGEISLLDAAAGGGCHGKSTTLGLQADEANDTRLIAMNDYGAGLMDI